MAVPQAGVTLGAGEPAAAAVFTRRRQGILVTFFTGHRSVSAHRSDGETSVMPLIRRDFESHCRVTGAAVSAEGAVIQLRLARPGNVGFVARDAVGRGAPEFQIPNILMAFGARQYRVTTREWEARAVVARAGLFSAVEALFRMAIGTFGAQSPAVRILVTGATALERARGGLLFVFVTSVAGDFLVSSSKGEPGVAVVERDRVPIVLRVTEGAVRSAV